jgi:hypothetical protein
MLVLALACASLSLTLLVCSACAWATTVTPPETNFTIETQTGVSFAFLITEMATVDCAQARSSSRTPSAQSNERPNGLVRMPFSQMQFITCSVSAGWAIPAGEGPVPTGGRWSWQAFKGPLGGLFAFFDAPARAIRFRLQRDGNPQRCILEVPGVAEGFLGRNWVNGGAASTVSTLAQIEGNATPTGAGGCFAGDGGAVTTIKGEIAAHWRISPAISIA